MPEAVFHITSTVKNSSWVIQKIGSTERIMPVNLAIELIQKWLWNFSVKTLNHLEPVSVVKNHLWWFYLRSHRDGVPNNNLDNLPTYG